MNKFGLIALIVFGAGCGMIKNMGEMHDATLHMQEATDKVGKTAEQTLRNVSGAYNNGRQGSSKMTRVEDIKALENSSNIGKKLLAASSFFMGMEYNFWTPGLDSEKYRTRKMEEAFDEFIETSFEYIHNHNNLSPASSNDMMENLYALSATLHKVNGNQTDVLVGTPYNEVSMLSILEDGMSKQADLDAGKISESDLPMYQVKVLRFRAHVLYILRVRQNFLKAFAYSRLSDEEDGDHSKKWQNIWRFLMTKFNKTWTPNFDKVNIAEINYDTLILKYAAETQAFLIKNGFYRSGDADSTMHTLLSYIDLSPYKAEEMVRSKNPADRVRGAAIKRFQDALNLVLSQDEMGSKEQLK